MKRIITILLLLACVVTQGQNLRKLGSTGSTNTLYGEFFYLAHPTFGVADSLKLTDKKYVDQALAAIGAGSAFGIDSTVISGTVGSVLFVKTGPTLGQNNANFFWNNTDIRLGIGNSAPESKLMITSNSLGVTATRSAGIIEINQTAAAAGAQQKSPGLWLIGQGWKTNATAASQEVAGMIDLLPVQAAANPTGIIQFNFGINGGAMTKRAQLSSAQGFLIGDVAPFPDATNLAYAVGDQTRGLWSAGSSILNARGGNSHIYFGGTTGIGFYTGLTLDQAAPSRYFHWKAYVNNTNTLENYRFTTVSNAGTGAAGFGPAFEFETENGSSALVIGARLGFPWVTATSGSEAQSFKVSLINAGTLAERFGIEPTGLASFGGSTSSFPALGPNGANLRARLADNSASTDLEVLDEAYDATAWNGSLEVPTKNAIRDKIESMGGGGGGLTSINSETGPAFTIAGGNGLTVNTTTNTATVVLGGTLSGATTINGGTQNLTLGASGNKIGTLTANAASIGLNSDGAINLYGSIKYLAVQHTADANLSVATTTGILELATASLTTDRTITLPSAATHGQVITIVVRFASSGNHYVLSSAVEDIKTGSTFTQLEWGTTYDFMVNASVGWMLIRKY